MGSEILVERSSSNKGFVSPADRTRIIDHANRKMHLTDEMYNHMKSRAASRVLSWFNRPGTTDNVTRCLGSEYTLRFKAASWNSLLQMVLISRSHAVSRKQKDDSYYSSLFQSSMPNTKHLLLSSQFDADDADDDSWIAPTKAAHDDAFDEYVADEHFCELDIEKLFQNEEFVNFFTATGR